MKVKIGKYITWIGGYQIADAIPFLSEDTKNKIGRWLAEDKNGNPSGLEKLCKLVYDFRKRTVKVEIDDYDIWNMDDTLCLIIHPMIKKLKHTKQGYGLIDKSDTPEHLRHTYDRNGFSEAAYDWVLDEIIWATSDQPEIEEMRYITAGNKEFLEYVYERKRNAMILFGKYFHTFWD